MRVEIKGGGDGVLCWNVGAVQAYATQINDREAHLAAQNPDVTVKPGRIRCYGCEVMEFDYGTRCTAQITRTRFVIAGELEPRAEDAEAPLSEIPGLLTKAPSDATVAPMPTMSPAAAPQPVANVAPPSRVLGPPPTPSTPKKSGLLGRLGRR